jgi:hypothetical protein
LGFVNASVELALDRARQQQMREVSPRSVAYLAWSAVCESFEEVLRDVLARHGQQFGMVDAVHLSGSMAPAKERLAHPHVSSLL